MLFLAQSTARVSHPRAPSRPDVNSAVIDRWYGPDHRYFKVAGDDGAIYILRHEPPTGSWRLTLYERGTAAPALSDGNRAR